MGPLGLAYTAYQLWRRLSPEQKQRIRAGAVNVARRARGRVAASSRHQQPEAVRNG